MTDLVPITSLFYDDAGPHIVSVPPALAARSSRLQSLLASGIAGLTPLDTQPFSKPAVIDDETTPIDDLLYKGRAALARAIEIRNSIVARASTPTQDELDELFDLLDLAARE